jgi:hypothetical protein
MRFFRRLPPQIQRRAEIVELQSLYEALSRLALDENRTGSLLERIYRKGLRISVNKLTRLPKVTAKFSWEVSTRWREAVACYAYGQHNAAIAMAAAACEVQLREELANRKGKTPRGTYGRLLMLKDGYEKFAKRYPCTLSRELWNLHRKMVEDYRNPYVHMDMKTLAGKRQVAVAGPPDFTKFYKGPPRLHDHNHRFFDRLALELQETDPSQAAFECMRLGHSILHARARSPE